jgi:D-lactate dehydrogenase
MQVAVFSTKPYDKRYLSQVNTSHLHDLHFFEPRLTAETLPLARGFPAVCAFVNDVLDGPTIRDLKGHGLRLIALRCAGFNNVDLVAADEHDVRVVRVPAYSPNSVAEHTVALLMGLNRKLHRAYTRVREGNFSLDGLLGFDVCRRNVGVIGTGKIGEAFCRIMVGFGSQVLAYDVHRNPRCESIGVRYVELDELLSESDILSLHCPLVPATHHLIDAAAIERMRPGVYLINTSRGGLVDTTAVIGGLKSGAIGALGLDVYEEEADLFFEDLSNTVIRDDVFARLLTFPNVLVTGHQAFFTEEALHAIASTTLSNISEFATSGQTPNAVHHAAVRA